MQIKVRKIIHKFLGNIAHSQLPVGSRETERGSLKERNDCRAVILLA